MGAPSAYIAGRLRRPARPDGEIERRDPGRTTQVVGRFPWALADVDEAVAAARAAGPAWAASSARQRAQCLRRLARVLAAEARGLARLITREVGKPLWESEQEVGRAIAKVEITLRESLRLVEPCRGSDGSRWSFRPKGVLAVLAPFNMPVHLPGGHIVPALATGNTVIVKPSELTPAVGICYARLFHRAGFPPGVFNLVLGGPEVGRALAAAPVDGVLFTGSFTTGRALGAAAAAADPGKLAALEMGGKNAAVVLADAPLERAVAECLFGAYATTGQRCTSTSRLILERRIAEEFLERFIAGARALVVGYGLRPGTFMGPLVSAQARRRFMRLLSEGRARGAEPLLAPSARSLPGTGHYVGPSVHLVKRRLPQSRYQNEELFGPDVAVYIVDSAEEAAAVAEASPYGLALSVFTRRRREVERIAARCRVGIVNWNRATTGASSHAPFGGQKRSGNDRPTALFAPYYCTYPVATLEGTADPPQRPLAPGMPPPPAGAGRAHAR